MPVPQGAGPRQGVTASRSRALARNGRVLWFQCAANMIRREDGQPWFIHGVGFDITDLKGTEQSLQDERNIVPGILETVGARVVVLGPSGQGPEIQPRLGADQRVPRRRLTRDDDPEGLGQVRGRGA